MRVKEIISSLADSTGFPKVSLFFPTHIRGVETQQNAIRMKNALQNAEAQLEKAGMGDREIEALLAEAGKKIDDFDFWQHQQNGLAVFIEDGKTAFHKLSFAPLEEVVVGDGFHTLPLCRMAGTGETFHVLALNRSGARLFDADEKAMHERGLTMTPETMADERGVTDFNDDTGFHPNSRGAQGGGAEGVPQGHSLGTSKDEQAETELWRFLTYVENLVGDALADSDAPIVLVGGDRIVGHYREAVDDPRIAAAVQKNATSLSDAEMFEQAREAIADRLNEPRRDAAGTIGARVGSGEKTASTDASEISEAAEAGRVETVLIDFAGRDGSHAAVLNRIAQATLKNGGTVLAMPKDADEKMLPVAAAFRY